MSKNSRRRAQRDAKQRQRRRAPLGAPPGLLKADPNAPPTLVTVFAYGPQGVVEKELTAATLGELKSLMETWPVVWVNLDGLGDVPLLQAVADLFHLHPLALEDVIYVHQRAKLEHFPEHQFLVLHQVFFAPQIEIEQVSLFLGKNFVLTFQEDVGDCLNPVRERIRHNVGVMRQQGPDYLAYSIIDAIVDYYFPVLEYYGERLEAVEDMIIQSPAHNAMNDIHEIKRQLLTLRRKIWPLRDALNTLVRDPVPQVTDGTRLYLRDCHDHVLRIIDFLETYRELGSDLLEFQLSSVSYRMNQVMQALTVIATIFIPLTFICSVYGMNFDPDSSPWNMPELRWYWGYPTVMAAMTALALFLLAVFYRKGWLTSPRARQPQVPQLAEPHRYTAPGNGPPPHHKT